MKTLLYSILALSVLTGCKKTLVNPNDTATTSAVPSGTASASSSANSNAVVNVNAPTQTVKISVSDKTLNLTYNEDVTLLAKAETLGKSWSVMFNEDFSATQLANVNYTSLTSAGTYAQNWVESNLNNIQLKSKKDTLINNVVMTKMQITRTFLFKNTYTSALQASQQYTALLGKKEVIKFSAYFTPVTANLGTATISSSIIYVAASSAN